MENLHSFIASGILESYVLGTASAGETELVEEMAGSSVDIRAEIDSISEAFELYALGNAVAPGPLVKPFVMATVDFSERMKHGEAAGVPPELQDHSRVRDYEQWLNMPGMRMPDNFNDLHVKIIGYTPRVITAIVWIKDLAPQEVHDNEYERFLIVEGTCDIIVDKEVHPLNPGDYFAIPLFKDHQVVVTSAIPCKVILQRIAA